jgi:hypothetical protein
MKKLSVGFAAAAVVALGAAAPASAHQGHTSCKPGASEAAKAPGPFGEMVRVGAQSEGAKDEVALLHELCQPKGP